MGKRRNEAVTVGIAVFSFLYAGTMLATPLYRNGHTLVRYMAMSLLLAFWVPLCVKMRLARGLPTKNGVTKVMAVVYALLTAFPAASFAAAWTSELSGYASAYGSLSVRLAAGFGCAFCAVYAAKKGQSAMTGVMTAAAFFFPLWTLIGQAAFLSTKTAFPLSPPLDGMTANDVISTAKELLSVLADGAVISLFVTKNSNRSGSAVKRGAAVGTAMFILLAGVNVTKNLLLLGEPLARVTSIPNLAAIRLVPMLELPEMSVIVGAVSLAVRLCVYAGLGADLWKAAFGKRTGMPAAIPFAVLFTVLAVSKKTLLPYHLPCAASSLAAAAAYAVSFDGKRQNKNHPDGSL